MNNIIPQFMFSVSENLAILVYFQTAKATIINAIQTLLLSYCSSCWLFEMMKTVTSWNYSSLISSNLQFTLICTCYPVKIECELKLM
jgi:hypothetical protein